MDASNVSNTIKRLLCALINVNIPIYKSDKQIITFIPE